MSDYVAAIRAWSEDQIQDLDNQITSVELKLGDLQKEHNRLREVRERIIEQRGLLSRLMSETTDLEIAHRLDMLGFSRQNEIITA